MENRFIANKFGLFNFWYYHDIQEFELLNGKIIFRGNNGSGKSVTTQSFIPLLLDGNKNPARLDPFGTKSRKIDNYLLMDENEEDRIAYLYIEFKKPSSNVYITIGMGLRARKGKQTESWYFILKDGRRINEDLKLYKVQHGEKYPLTSKEFENALQGDKNANIFTKSQTEYMRKVNEHLYGYSNIDDYKDLLSLLIQLRSPKLSKDFKPTVIYEILKGSLSTLSEDDLRPMAEAMDNMDSLNEKIEELEKSLKVCSALKRELDNYNMYNLYIKCKNYKTKRDELKLKINELENLKKELEHKKERLSLHETELESLNIDLEKAKIKEENLKQNEAFGVKNNIENQKLDLQNLKNDLISIEKNYDKKLSDKTKIKEQIDNLEKNIYVSEKEFKDLIQDEINLREDIYFNPINNVDKNTLEDENYDFSPLFDEIDDFSNLISSIYSKIVEYENKSKEFKDSEQKLDSKKKDVAVCESKLNENQEYLTAVKGEYIDKINIYMENIEELKLEKDDLEDIFSIIHKIENEYGYFEVENKVKSISNDLKGKLLNEKRYLEEKQKIALDDKKQLESDIKKLESTKEIFEEDEDYIKSKKILDDNKIDYEIFYKSVRFKDSIEDRDRKIIEKSLLNMGILNSFIVCDKDMKKALELLKETSYKILSKDKNLSEIDSLQKYFDLESSDFNKSNSFKVKDILCSICDIENESNSACLNIENGYKIGIINGRADSNYILKYIGSKSREDYRLSKIKTIKSQISDIEKNIEKIIESSAHLQDKIEKLEKEAKLFPNGDDIKTSIKMIYEAIEKLNTQEAALNSLEERYYTSKKEYQKIKSELFDMTSGINIPTDINSYKDILSNIRIYGKIIREINSVYNNISSAKKDLKLREETLESLNYDIDQISSNKIDLNYKIKLIMESIKSLEEVLASMNLGEIEKELESVTNIVVTYPLKIEKLKIENAKLEKDIENDLKNINIKTKENQAKEKIVSIYENILDDELNLKYIDNLKELNIEEALIWITKNLNKFDNIKNDPSNKIHDKIGKHEHDLTDYNITKVILFDDYKKTDDDEINQILKNAARVDVVFKLNKKAISVYELEKYLDSTLKDQRLLISDKEREVFEDILLNTLSTKISARINRAKAWVKNINSLMDNIDTSNGLKLNLRWDAKKTDNEDELDIKKLTDIFRKSQFITEDEKRRVSEHFKIQLKKKKRDLMEKDSSVSYQTIIKDVLDYRAWYEFKLMFSKDNKNKEMTDNEFFRLSGGEKAMSMYVPLFAAVNARYDSADKKDCPRIISLDEAFAGVDEKNIESMFRLIESLNLDYVLNSQVLWGTYESVKNIAIYELIRHGEDIVVPIRYTWNGKDRIVNI